MAPTFWSVLAARAASDGSRDAIRQGPVRLTFAAWHARASALASWYTSTAGAPGQRVLLWMQTSPDMAVAILGLWKAGAIVTMMDARSSARHFEHALRTAEPSLILCDDPAAIPVDGHGVRVQSFAGLDLDARVPDTGAGPLPTDPAYVIFTSGSTGLPKGVTQCHAHLVRGYRTVAGYLGLNADDRLLCATPLSYSYGSGQMLSALTAGATLVLPETPDLAALCESIGRDRPTRLAVIPSILVALAWGLSPLRRTDVSSLRGIITAGAPIPRPVLEEVRRLLPGCPFVNNYGLTESLRTTTLPPQELAGRPDSVGRPVAGVSVAIVREDGSLAGPGETGEIVHRGDYLFLGYWNDPDATARALRQDPLAPAGCPNPARVLYTGDLGYLDEAGFLYVSGRRDHVIKSMGVRVNPAEIEDLLYRSGLVSEAAIVGRAHELLDHEIVAVVVPQPGVNGDLRQQLMRHARATMSPYMLPRRILVRAALPRTQTGKVDYRALVQEVATGS
jgi:acyl-coenzyme A synthetase/AMP-(fatty) acid ligase